MSRPIAIRLLWKEYRIQRAFWISALAVAAAVQVAALALANPGSDRMEWLYGTALAATALYALGCGAVLFAAEHEFGTYEFQRVLPVTAGGLLSGKLWFAAVSIPAMAGLLWLSAIGLAGGESPDWATARGLWGLWGMGVVEVFVWSVLFSLVTMRAITAAVLGSAAASFVVHFMVAPLVQSQMHRYWETAVYVQALPQRGAVALLVAAADVWLGLRWLRGEPQWRWFPEALPARAAGRSSSARLLRCCRGEFSRLVWQHWRQSASLMFAVVCGVLLLAAPGVGSQWVPEHMGRIFDLAWCFAVAGVALLGACAFMADQQRGSFRFFADRGISPGAVWWSRQLVWGLPALGIMAMVFCGALVFSPRNDPPAWQALGSRGPLFNAWEMWQAGLWVVDYAHVGRVVGYLVLAYAAGQLCSILLRSGILAGVFGLAAGALAVGWARLMVGLGVPWFWSVLPVPVVLLAASRWRAPDWLLERGGLRARLKVVGMLGLPAAALCGGVVAYRVYQIPRVDPGFSPEEYARPATAAERETMAIYQRAWNAYTPEQDVEVAGVIEGRRSSRLVGSRKDYEYRAPVGRPGVTPYATVNKRPGRGEEWEPRELPKSRVAYVAVNGRSLELALEASRRKEADFFSRDGATPPLLMEVGQLGRLVLSSGQVLASRGEYEQAADRYLAALRISKHLRHRSIQVDEADWLERSVGRALMDWARRGKASAKQIAGVLGRLKEELAEMPSPGDVIKSKYFLLRAFAAGDSKAAPSNWPEARLRHWEIKAAWIPRLAPWESVRAARLIDVMTREDLALQPEQVTWQPWVATTPLLWDLGWGRYGEVAVKQYVAMEAWRRAVVLTLTLTLQAREAEQGRAGSG